MKKIILILAGIIIVAVLGRLGWAFWQMQNDPAFTSANIDIGGGNENPAKFAVNGVDAEKIAVTPFSVSSNTPTKPAINQVKSEVDKYGVELYTLKQGVTTVVKNIDGKSGKIVYTRSKNSIERVSSVHSTDGSQQTLTITVDLDVKEKLPAAIKEMEDKFLTDCKDASTKECVASKMVIDYIKTNCVALQKNEEVSTCMIAGVMRAWANQAQ